MYNILDYFDINKTMIKYDTKTKTIELEGSYIDIFNYDHGSYSSDSSEKEYISIYKAPSRPLELGTRIAFFLQKINTNSYLTLELRSNKYIGNVIAGFDHYCNTRKSNYSLDTADGTYTSGEGADIHFIRPVELESGLYRCKTDSSDFLNNGRVEIYSTNIKDFKGKKGSLNTNIPFFIEEEDCDNFLKTGEGIEKAINFGVLKEPLLDDKQHSLFPGMIGNHGVSKKFLKGLANTVRYLDQHYSLIPYNELKDKIRSRIIDGAATHRYDSINGVFSRIEIIDNFLVDNIKDIENKGYIEVEYYFYNGTNGLTSSLESEGIINIFKCRYDNIKINGDLTHITDTSKVNCYLIHNILHSIFTQPGFHFVIQDKNMDVSNADFRCTKTHTDITGNIHIEECPSIVIDDLMDLSKFYKEFYDKYRSDYGWLSDTNNTKNYIKINTNIPLFATPHDAVESLQSEENIGLPCNFLGNIKPDYKPNHGDFDYSNYCKQYPYSSLLSFPEYQIYFLNKRTKASDNHKFIPKNLKELPAILFLIGD